MADRLVQCIEDEACCHRGGHSPTYDFAGEDIDDKSNIDHAPPSRYVGKVGHPELIGECRFELPVDLVIWARLGGVRDRRLLLAAGNPM